MKNFVQPGNTITVVATEDVVSGEFVVFGSMFGVAVTDAATGESFAMSLGGVYTLPKATGTAWTVGAPLYYDATNFVITTDDDSGSNAKVGVAVEAVGSAVEEGAVRLNASF